MEWFGSLDLAMKYIVVFGSLIVLVFFAGLIKVLYNRRRLKKHIKVAAELEASGNREERVELNARELDEGDLFGVRAIQSGYYGGVAQSRPTSAAGSHSPAGSSSNIFAGSHPSPNLIATTPMSSVTSLPSDPKPTPSPSHSPSLPNGAGRTATPGRPTPRPIKSGLRPSEAELSGRINHDPAVNMSLEIPPSPLTSTRPPIPNGGSYAPSSPGSRSPSPSYPFPSAGNDHRAPAAALHPDVPKEIKVSARPVSTAERHKPQVHSQSASVVSRSSDNSNHDGHRSPYQEYTESPTRPARALYAERSSSRGSYHLPRMSSPPHGAPLPNVAEDQGPAADDWGTDIFHEIDQSIHDSKSMATPPPNHVDANQVDSNQIEPNPVYSHHASKLSDSSSVYSSTGHRYSTKKLSMDSKSLSQTPSTIPSSAPSEHEEQHRHSPELAAGTRPGSDASTHQAASSNHSTKGSTTRHTTDLGDFYDSYWRQSNQAPFAGFAASRGAGDAGKEAKRPGQMEVKVATITEVPSPLPSPMPGTAL